VLIPTHRVAITKERNVSIDNLLIRIHFIIKRIWWTGLAAWEVEFAFSLQVTATSAEGVQTNRLLWKAGVACVCCFFCFISLQFKVE